MPTLPLRWKMALAGLAGWAVIAWAFGRPLDPAARTLAQAEQVEPRPVYFGVKGCSDLGCHASEAPRVEKEPLVCNCNEVTIWQGQDKHALAYHVIDTKDGDKVKTARARKMEEALGYKVYEDRRCLACHAVVVDAKFQKDKTFDVKEGVNCVVCHGAYRNWVVEHSARVGRDEWRKLSRSDKEKKMGMTDLWNPVKRVRLCASCHVGSPEEGKFVTHEMYAAGHPPLPSFEPASFSNQMPRHWAYVREKSPEVQKLQGLSQADFEQTKVVLVGAALALSRSMHSLARHACEADEAPNDDSKALDLSHFDCYACHHDLRSPSWRVQRAVPGKPGRVPMKQWPTALVKLAARQVGADQANCDRLIGALQDAFVARPYGDPARIAREAPALAKWADSLAESVNASKVNSAVAQQMLKLAPGLYGGKDAPLLDYDSARQVAWACQAIYAELLKAKADDPRVLKPFEALDGLLKLRLPRAPRLVEDDLKVSLEKLYGYDPATFQSLMGKLNLP